MPYIITPGIQTTDSGTNFDSIAVATLEDARWCVAEMIANLNSIAEGFGPSLAFTPYERALADEAISSHGGTVSSLPDCRVINVRFVSPLKLAALAGMSGADVMACKGASGDWDFAPIIEAFNGA